MAMRILLAAAFIALLAVAAHAQGAGTRKGASPRPDAQKTEDLAKKKADEQAYKDALKQIPVSKEKPDPWKTMR
jgi:hypothetical protein